MPSIAVIGPGAIGGTVAARLAQISSHAVTICARTSFDQLTIETSAGVLVATPRVIVAPDAAEAVDWVLIATKAYDVAGTVAWLPPLLGPFTRVAVLQNGVEHIERFAPHMPVGSLVPVVVDLPAERLGPGHVRQRSDGTLTVPADENGRDFVQLFIATGLSASTTPDFRSQMWRKLTVNSAGAVSALTLRPAGITSQEPVADIMRALMCECIAVGRAEGAALEDDLVEAVIAGYRKGPADAINSLHADRLAGRPIEIDARNGAVVRIGRRHGIATPVNEMIVTLLKVAATDA